MASSKNFTWTIETPGFQRLHIAWLAFHGISMGISYEMDNYPLKETKLV